MTPGQPVGQPSEDVCVVTEPGDQDRFGVSHWSSSRAATARHRYNGAQRTGRSVGGLTVLCVTPKSTRSPSGRTLARVLHASGDLLRQRRGELPSPQPQGEIYPAGHAAARDEVAVVHHSFSDERRPSGLEVVPGAAMRTCPPAPYDA